MIESRKRPDIQDMWLVCNGLREYMTLFIYKRNDTCSFIWYLFLSLCFFPSLFCFTSLKFMLLLLNCFDLFLVWSVLFRVMKDYMVFLNSYEWCLLCAENKHTKTKLSFLNCVQSCRCVLFLNLTCNKNEREVSALKSKHKTIFSTSFIEISLS